MGTRRNDFRAATSRLSIACGLFCLLVAGRAVVAAVDEQEIGANPRSLVLGKAAAPLQRVVSPEAPTVAGCAVTALVSDGSISPLERAPNANYLFGRSVWLITSSELANNGLLNGTILSAIGFRYQTAPGADATGLLKVYLQNTSDLSNTKSTTWATAIAGMTLVHNNALTTLPNTTAPFDIPFSGTGISSFTYTGGALYVAFDWQWGGVPSTTTQVACNSTGPASGLLGAQSSSAAPTILSQTSFRPETRFTPSVTTILNDASVDALISVGSLPQSLVGPQTIQAVITNKGANALSNLPVTLNVTGAQTYTNVQTIIGPLAGCGGQTVVSFAPFTLTALGSDTVTVSVPADNVSTNNSRTRPLASTSNLYSYKRPGTTATGGVGVTADTADFLAKFTITAAAKVSAVNLEFYATSVTAYRVAIYPESSPGSGAPGLTPIYEDAADRAVTLAGPVTITLPAPVSVGPGTFFAGVEQTNTTNANISYDAEAPVRSGAFFLAIPHPPTAWSDFSPGNDFLLNIGVTLVQCQTTADCNDNNPCTDEVCTNSLCVSTNNNATSCDGNPCSNPDQCINGTCIPGPNPCNDNNACTVDQCVGGGGCTYAPLNCDDNNPCTADSCLPASGCAHANTTGPCSDNDPCTVGDACAGGVCVPGSGALPSPVQFCNNAATTIPTIGAATPYPSSIVVTGQPPYLCTVTVNINGFTHTYPSDVDVLLARPSGSNALILSDVGGGTAVTGLTFQLSDAASTPLPSVGPLASGPYKPTNYGAGDTFPVPAPAPTGGSALSIFRGTNPNGSWNLWVDDQFSPDGGSIGGWCVSVVSACVLDANCDDGNVCTNDVCANGACTHTNNQSPCNDNNPCTASDACSGGVCVGGAPVSCDDGNPCTSNICNTQTGQCQNPPIVCNDNNPCTNDSCNPATGCVYTANTAACNDNNLCTPTDVCVNGVCVGQNPVSCPPDANPCTTEACDPATGQCASTNNTNACDDGNACTTGDVCGPKFSEGFDGVTAPSLPGLWATSVTGSGNPWTSVGTSSDTAPNSAFGYDGPAVADEVLVTPPIAITSASAKLTFKTRWSFEGTTTFFDGGVLEISIGGGAFTDVLATGGSFVSGGYTGTISTSFGNPLAGRSAWGGISAGYPAYLTTLVNLPVAAAGQSIQLRWRIGTDSTDGAAGQNVDSIVLQDGANVCNVGTGTRVCDDNNPCTTDSCVPSTGCLFAPNANACDDGNACTAGDTCGNGTCNAGAAVVCNDFNACTTDSCSPATGCVFANNTNPCDDGNPCTAGDVCGGGVCAGTPAAPPAETQNLTVAANKTTFSWTAVASAIRYDVVRGALGALPVGPGAGDEVCFGNLAVPSLTDATVPAVSSGFWYLSRGESACASGTFGTQGVHGAPGAARVTTTCQ